MKAGRELDELVTEKVMGGAWACGFLCPECGGVAFGSDLVAQTRECHGGETYNCSWRGPASAAPPAFSTDIAATWEVAEHIRIAMGDIVIDTALYGWRCRIRLPTGWPEDAYAETAPLAICLAALKVVGAEVPA